MSYFYMSFCDTTRPKGTQHLGNCLVEAANFPAALEKATKLGINPGGEVAFFEMDEIAPEGRSIINKFTPHGEITDGMTISEVEEEFDVDYHVVCQKHNPSKRQ